MEVHAAEEAERKQREAEARARQELEAQEAAWLAEAQRAEAEARRAAIAFGLLLTAFTSFGFCSFFSTMRAVQARAVPATGAGALDVSRSAREASSPACYHGKVLAANLRRDDFSTHNS